MFQAVCKGPSTSYSGVSYTTSLIFLLSQPVISSSSESESEYDLSDIEAEVMFINSETLADSIDSMPSSSSSDTEGTMSALADVSSHDSSDNKPMDFSKSKSRGRGIRGRGKGGSGRRGSISKASGRRQRHDFDIYGLNTVDNNVPSLHQFNPSRSVGIHLSLHSEDWSEFFKVYFDSE